MMSQTHVMTSFIYSLGLIHLYLRWPKN